MHTSVGRCMNLTDLAVHAHPEDVVKVNFRLINNTHSDKTGGGYSPARPARVRGLGNRRPAAGSSALSSQLCGALNVCLCAPNNDFLSHKGAWEHEEMGRGKEGGVTQA